MPVRLDTKREVFVISSVRIPVRGVGESSSRPKKGVPPAAGRSPYVLQGLRVGGAAPRGNAWHGPSCVPERAQVRRAVWPLVKRVGR